MRIGPSSCVLRAEESFCELPGVALTPQKIPFPDVGIFTPTGPVGQPIVADSGEQLRVWWIKPGLFGGRYELRYSGPVPPPGPNGRVGQCHSTT